MPLLSRAPITPATFVPWLCPASQGMGQGLPRFQLPSLM